MKIKESTGAVTFSDIMRGLQHSVNVVNEVLNQQYIDALQRYFDLDGNPKTITLQINPKKLHVPIISLLPHKPIVVDEIELEFQANFDINDIKNKKSFDENDIQRASFNVDMKRNGRNKSVMDIKIKYKAGEVPEGYSRVMDEVQSIIGFAESE